MRLDVYLKVSRLIPRRTQAKEACDSGLVRINGHEAKASSPVCIGATVELRTADRCRIYQITEIPSGSIPKKLAPGLYRLLQDEPRYPTL